MSNEKEILVEEVTQGIHEQHLLNRFDFLTTQNEPQKGEVILRLLGFGVMRLAGIDPDEAQVGNIVVEVTHSGFYTQVCAQVSLKVINGARGWASTS